MDKTVWEVIEIEKKMSQKSTNDAMKIVLVLPGISNTVFF